MANFSHTDAPASEVFLVASGNQALASGSLYPASGTALGILDGQLGLIAADDSGTVAKNAFLTAGQTIANAPRVKLVQGTPNSADIAGLSGNTSVFQDRPVVESRVIDSAHSIAITGRVANVGSRSAWLIGSATAANAITVVDNFEYELKLTFDGRRKNKTYGVNSFDNVQPAFSGPAYSTLSYTSDVDHIVKNLTYTANLQSAAVDHAPNKYGGTKPFIALAIDLDGAGTGTAISAVAAGTPFNFMVRNGQTLTYTPDAQFVATLTDMVANTELLNTSEIQVIDLSSAGSDAADAILIVALDDRMATVTDRETTKRVRIRLGAGDGKMGNTELNIDEGSYAEEDNGTGRYWHIRYKEHAEHSIWSEQVVGDNRSTIVVPSYITNSDTAYYNITSIFHKDYRESEYEKTVKRPHVTHILVPATSAGVGEATTVTSLNAIVGPWLDSATIEHEDAAAALNAPFA